MTLFFSFLLHLTYVLRVVGFSMHGSSSTTCSSSWSNIHPIHITKHPFSSFNTPRTSTTSLFSFQSKEDEDSTTSSSSSSSSPSSVGNFFDEINDFTNYNEDDEEEDEPYPDLYDEFDEYIPKINSVTLVGRVGNVPEPRYFGDNKVVLRLSLAVKRKYHPLERQVRNIQSGEEETDWFNLELWGRDAEYAGKYVTKGARIGITGKLNVDTWNDKVTGEERTSRKVVVKHLDILESRAEAELRMGNRGKYSGGGNSNSGGGMDYGDGPSSGGSGGFFDS